MIQRIQTLYLLVVAVLMTMTVLMPLGTLSQDNYEVVLYAFGVTGIPEAAGTFDSFVPLLLGCLLLLPTLLPIVIIFLFKKRMLQLRLCVSEIVLLLGSLAFIGIYCYRLHESLESLESVGGDWLFTLGFASILPIISIILTCLAIRGIAKDEALVRSLDRIR
jgi:hypothetical protein